MNTVPQTAPDRQIFTVNGKDRLTFLQGMVSNDVLRLAGGDGIIWCALLTPQGKYLADFFLIAQGDDLLLDIKQAYATNSLKRLLMYRLRADIQIIPSDLFVLRGLGTPPPGAVEDPRHPALGWRIYSPHQGAAPTIDWDALRVAHVIPETGIELIADESYILENGFERLHGVDFRKGCYVGQEVTARMKHKTELRKGLVQVLIKGSAAVGAPIMVGDKPGGTLFTQSGGKALAYLRFDRVDGLTADAAEITLPSTVDLTP
jgi:folate-binding protein YgfZ